MKAPLPFVRDDGGRAGAGLMEKKDCTVRALAIASGVPYLYAHQILSKLGRPHGKGFKFVKVARHLGMTEHVQPVRGRMRVMTAVKKYSKGRFVFRVSGHAFAVVDGVCHDICAPDGLARCIVTHVWAVNPLTPGPC